MLDHYGCGYSYAEVREAVWVLASRAGDDESGGTLLLLDAGGYRLLIVHEMRCPLHSVGPVVRAAGLPFSVYHLGTGGGGEAHRGVVPARDGSTEAQN